MNAEIPNTFIPEEQLTPARLLNEAQLENGTFRPRRAIDILNHILEGKTEPELQIQALCELGLANRLFANPDGTHSHYPDAERYYKQALGIAREIGENQGSLMALTGLMDLYRTGDRDPGFGQDLDKADSYIAPIQSLLERIKAENKAPTLAELKAHMQMGHLVEYNHKNYREALDHYALANAVGEFLSTTEPNNIVIARAAVNADNAVGELMYHFDPTHPELLSKRTEKNYYRFIELGDTRSAGNHAGYLGKHYEKLDELSLALEWFKKAAEVSKEKDPEIYLASQQHILRFEAAIATSV